MSPDDREMRVWGGESHPDSQAMFQGAVCGVVLALTVALIWLAVSL